MNQPPPTLIDTHAHLDDEQFAADVASVIERALAAGVARIINIGYRPSRWTTTLALAGQFPEIAYSLGLHPNHAGEWNSNVERELINLLSTSKPVAIGEIGLDYFRHHASPDVQKEVFVRQLEIATEFGLPVIIHQREAEDDLMPILETTSPDLVCVLHSFDGSVRLAEFARSRGYYLGVGGLMTREKASIVREIITKYPLDRLLFETDSPYLVPAGIKNRRNEPANLPVVASKLAELFDRSVEEVVEITSANATRLFPALLSATATTPRGNA